MSMSTACPIFLSKLISSIRRFIDELLVPGIPIFWFLVQHYTLLPVP
jgi:hypothetical protein